MARYIKNDRKRHCWKITGGYDAAQDGPDPWWGRIAVRCQRCGETRRIFSAVDDIGLRYGCIRKGNPDAWQKDDLLVLDGCIREHFVSVLPNGLVLSWNLGGHYTEADRSRYAGEIAEK
jgi:hypothetical protein